MLLVGSEYAEVVYHSFILGTRWDCMACPRIRYFQSKLAQIKRVFSLLLLHEYQVTTGLRVCSWIVKTQCKHSGQNSKNSVRTICMNAVLCQQTRHSDFESIVCVCVLSAIRSHSTYDYSNRVVKVCANLFWGTVLLLHPSESPWQSGGYETQCPKF